MSVHPSTPANREAAELQVTTCKVRNLDTVGSANTSLGCAEPQHSPVKTTGLASGTEPLRKGLRLTVSRQAKAAPGGVYVRPRRERCAG